MKNIAVILAGGSGRRFNGEIPKQFVKIGGRMVVEHTIEAFQKCGRIDEIAVVIRPGYEKEIEEIVIRNRFDKVKRILEGGNERYHSSLAAIGAYADDDDVLIFHDAVRPLVSERIINDCIDAMATYNAVDVGVPATDTVMEVNDRNEIIGIPDRSKLRNSQTPQVFRRGVIRRAYEKALNDPEFKTTDDCGVVLRYLPEEPILIVNGDPFNIKLTYKTDLMMFENILSVIKKLKQNDEEPIS